MKSSRSTGSVKEIAAIRHDLVESARLKEALGAEYCAAIAAMGKAMIRTLKRGGKILICGNGGSAADAQHIACEMVVKFRRQRRGLPALALSVNTSVLTAAANDLGFQSIFARQVEALGKKGDVLIAISTSGKSPNVLAAVRQARRMGVKTVALSGGTGGSLAKLCDLSLTIPSDSVPRIQEAHITVGHILCEMVEEASG